MEIKFNFKKLMPAFATDCGGCASHSCGGGR